MVWASPGRGGCRRGRSGEWDFFRYGGTTLYWQARDNNSHPSEQRRRITDYFLVYNHNFKTNTSIRSLTDITTTEKLSEPAPQPTNANPSFPSFSLSSVGITTSTCTPAMASKQTGTEAFAPVLEALATMQSNVARDQKNQAHEFLEKFQKSVRLAALVDGGVLTLRTGRSMASNDCSPATRRRTSRIEAFCCYNIEGKGMRRDRKRTNCAGCELMQTDVC